MWSAQCNARIARIKKVNYNRALTDYTNAYNSWPHVVTGIPPADVMFNRKINFFLPRNTDDNNDFDFDKEEFKERNDRYQLQQKQCQDKKRKAKLNAIHIDDTVFVKSQLLDKLAPRFINKKMKVIAKAGGTVVLQAQDGTITTRAVQYVAKVQEQLNKDSDNETRFHPSDEHDDGDKILERTVQTDAENNNRKNSSAKL